MSAKLFTRELKWHSLYTIRDCATHTMLIYFFTLPAVVLFSNNYPFTGDFWGQCVLVSSNAHSG